MLPARPISSSSSANRWESEATWAAWAAADQGLQKGLREFQGGFSHGQFHIGCGLVL
jgi:hypothetical protein